MDKRCGKNTDEASACAWPYAEHPKIKSIKKLDAKNEPHQKYNAKRHY